MVDGIDLLLVVETEEDDGGDQEDIGEKGFAAMFKLMKTAGSDENQEQEGEHEMCQC